VQQKATVVSSRMLDLMPTRFSSFLCQTITGIQFVLCMLCFISAIFCYAKNTADKLLEQIRNTNV
jgi:succinate dehydrogenase hydrophobic anchor subunit